MINITLVNVHYITYCYGIDVCVWLGKEKHGCLGWVTECVFMKYNCDISLASISLFGIEITDSRRHSVITRPFSSWEGVVWARDYYQGGQEALPTKGTRFTQCPDQWPVTFCLWAFSKTRPQACPFSCDPPHPSLPTLMLFLISNSEYTSFSVY